MVKNMCLALVVIVSCTFIDAKISHVVFDLDVLFDHVPTGAFANGFLSMMGKSVDSIREQLFEILSRATCPDVPCSNMIYKGKKMPLLWCAYYLDVFTPEEVLRRAKEVIRDNTGWLGFERKMLTTAAEYAFNPQQEVTLITPNESMFAVARTLKEREIHVILCTNKNSASWQVIKDQYPEHFALFEDAIFISGTEQALKPSREAYDKLVKKFALQPGQTLCIESQPEYASQIESFGFKVKLHSQVISDDSCAFILGQCD